MILNKIADYQSISYLHLTQSEILTIDWRDSNNLRYYTFDKSKEMRSVDKNYFGLSTVGENYLKIEQQLLRPIEGYCSTKGDNGDIYFGSETDNKIYRFDKEGNKTLEWEIEIGVGHPFCDLKFESPDYIWLAFPTGQTVSKVSISEQKEMFRIGDYTWDDDSEFLSYPESIFIKDRYLFIPNMGNNRLYRVDLKTLEMKLINTFEEKLWQYVQAEFGTFIVTDSGIYEIIE